jgi:hypothetical protein
MHLFWTPVFTGVTAFYTLIKKRLYPGLTQPTKKYLFVQAVAYSLKTYHLTYNYRIKFACFKTGAALDAFFEADRVELLLFAGGRLRRTDPCAGMTARALFGVNSIGNQRLADACRALFILDMSLILMAKIFYCGEHGIGR